MSDEHDPFDLKGQERRTKAKADAQALEAQNELADFKWLMGEKRGRRVVWRLLEQAGVWRSSFNPSGTVMAFNEGNRDVGLKLMRMINGHCGPEYLQMLEERQNARRNPDDAG